MDKISGASPDTTVTARLPGAGSHDTAEGDVPKNLKIVYLELRDKVGIEELLSQTWDFKDADRAHWDRIFWDSASDTHMTPQLALFADHTVTQDARCPGHRLRMGKWSLDRDTRKLHLDLSDGQTSIYFIRQFSIRSLELSLEKNKHDIAAITARSNAVVHADPTGDPFYPSNNRWRVKPKMAENEDQLRERVRGFVHFFALFYWDIYLRGNNSIDFNGLPNCFVWYNGGIGMQTRSDLDRRWIDCFYSEDQAFRGYDMLGDILESHVLKWPEHPTSWVKQTAQVLDQMAEKLK